MKDEGFIPPKIIAVQALKHFHKKLNWGRGGTMFKILALDTATVTGWAYWEPGYTNPESGTQDFSLKRGESPGMRFIRFRKWIQTFEPPDLYIYEEAHHRGGAATAVGVGFVSRVLEEAARVGAETVGVHTGTLKKWSTGHGKASKEQMIYVSSVRWGFVPKDDNEADALCLLAYGLEEYGHAQAKGEG